MLFRSIITVLTAIVLITVIIKIHNKQENIVTDDDLSKTEIGSGVTDNAIKSKSAKSITDSNTNVEIESEKTDSNNKTYESIEFIGIDNYDDWSAANFYDTDGNEVEYIDNKYFSDFEETGCSITVTLKYLNTDYYVFAPKDAVDWNALYKLDGNYRSLLFNADGTPTKRSGKILGGTPMNRFVDAEELLGGVFFLTDDKAASAITGVVLPIDAGFSAYSGV